MKTQEMTDNEIRIAVAEACGWKAVRAHWEKGEEIAFLNDSHAHRQLPDYLNSCDAILAVVRLLIFSKRQRFFRELSKVFSPKVRIVPHHAMLMATPRQYCEAFLATLNP